MTRQLTSEGTCTGSTGDSPGSCNPQRIIELLSDSTSRDIYSYVTEPKSIGDIATTLDIPQSTAYRKVEQLEQAGLLTELVSDGPVTVPSLYARDIGKVRVTFDEQVRIECNKAGRKLFCTPDRKTA